MNTMDWWKEGEPARVCKGCKNKITKYEAAREIIKELYKHPPKLGDIQRTEGNPETYTTAMGYYLSEMRRIQYLFPSDELSRPHINFLLANKEILLEHSYWLAQLLKVQKMPELQSKSLESSGIRRNGSFSLEISQEELSNQGISVLCTRSCRRTLHLGNAVDMILFSDIYSESQDYAHKMIKEASAEDLEPHLPALVSTFNGTIMELLTQKATENPMFANSLYWTLNVVGSPKATAYRENLLLQTRIKGDLRGSPNFVGVIDLRRIIGVLDAGEQEEVKRIVTEFAITDPFDPKHLIKSVTNTQTGKSHSRPIFITYQNDEGKTKTMMYKREDVRKDACIVRLIRLVTDTLKGISPQRTFPLISYNVIPISAVSGIVEIIPGCQTLAQVYRAGSVSNFLHKHNANQTISEVQSTYKLSLAFWTVITFIFGVRDRHFDNIMISEKGILFHIDYGFIFGDDPKLYSPEIRLNAYMLEGIGGDECYPEFKELCYKIFMTIRQNMDLMYTLLMNLALAEPKMNITEKFIKTHLSKVFFVGDTDEEVKDRLGFIIDSSVNAISGGVNDYIHTFSKTTSGVMTYLRS